jgi:predicted O-methyltransferase YrrM
MTNNFDNVHKAFSDLQYMRVPQAVLMRDFIVEHAVRDILEIGFYHGKSSAYFAAILEDLGRGHLLTIDLVSAQKRELNIDQVLSTLGLRHRVTPVFAERSYTWELGKMIRTVPRPQFDLCYFDGGHTWDLTGFGFLLVDMLLRPGGWIIFDDLEWTMQSAMKDRPVPPRQWRACSADEQATPGVKLVFDLLVPHLGYTDRSVINGGRWGIARKPVLAAQQQLQHAPGLLKRLLGTPTNR